MNKTRFKSQNQLIASRTRATVCFTRSTINCALWSFVVGFQLSGDVIISSNAVFELFLTNCAPYTHTNE